MTLLTPTSFRTWVVVATSLFMIMASSLVPAQEPAATVADSLSVLDGFKAELVYSVPKQTQGSWVSLCVEKHGRLVASDQDGSLYRITPAAIGSGGKAVVEKLAVKIGSAHGLLYAFESLYVVINGESHGRKSGLYRLRDTNSDDKYDEIVQLKRIDGGGEHGPHGVLLTPDGQSLVVTCGNHTNVPANVTRSLVPRNWDEDLLLPRQWDAKGHARGRMAPGGWIAKTDPDAETWEIVSVGYRNEYDAAFNAHGELFTYDSDMEWDMGAPWYRPTRVCHVTSGSEFGWRSGTGKWPEYYSDSLPATLNIGPGSPTGITSGAGAKFPAKYQHALYMLDWTYGTMYAVHLEPLGASYTATKEEFVSGKPLPLADAVIGSDGAMYFVIGGRGTQSGLYRITYVGSESTGPSPATDDAVAARVRALRRKLESFHGKLDPDAVDVAWRHLGHPDRFVRYAARVAIEHQDTVHWVNRALTEREPQTALTALIALARQGDPALQQRALDALGRIDFGALRKDQMIEYLRTLSLIGIRMGKPDRRTASGIAASLDSVYPTGDDVVNRELSRVLVYLDSPHVVSKTLRLMASVEQESAPDIQSLIARNDSFGGTVAKMLENQPIRQKIHYAFVLRNVRLGWTAEQRRQYFQWFSAADAASGGASYQGFLANIRKEALANCSNSERQALADITGESIAVDAHKGPIPSPVGPGKKWTLKDLLPDVESGVRGRNFDNGQKMYRAGRCAMCHRFDGVGGSVGPDLTSLVSRFSYRDVLEATLSPSNVISDLYGSTVIFKKDGTVIAGRIVGDTATELSVVVDPLQPDKSMVIKKADVTTMQPAPVSLMPAGLVDSMNKDEILDLLAYLMSRGDKKDRGFR